MYITSKNIRFGFMELTNVGWISIKEHDAIYKRCDVKPGDVLLTKDGANTGNAAINTIDKPFSLLSSVALLRCNEKKLHNMFLLQTLLSPLFQKNINDSMSGNAITRLTLNKIKEFQFAIPPLQEQYLISKSLANIQGKIDVEARLSGKLIIIKHGLMHDLLTGTVRVPANLLEATP
jgi:type I restriction enzyme S subunit